MSDHAELPLFPLNTVLVPGGHLPLRIFERRYLDMVRWCSSEGQPFGVVLVVQTEEPGQAAHVRIGSAAHITDFNTLEDGLLGITAQGGQKFQVLSTRGRDDGLLFADVRYLEPEPPTALPPEFGLLGDITRGFLERLDGQFPDAVPEQLDDASWVGFRLTELLPLDNAEKQALLELTDPLTRLQVLLEVLPRFQAEDDE
ncbi:MAG: LON peptidase substrate-binding domain-containing protein [Xanthomonadales bacterium]|nr:LON peptidase substrate-binding domain-containing protein [Xanthomonadales bacterium]